MLDGEFLDLDAVSALGTAEIFSVGCASNGIGFATAVSPWVVAGRDSIMNLKLQVIRSAPCSKVADVESDNELKVFGVDSGEIFLYVIRVDVASGEGKSGAVEQGWTGGLEAIERKGVSGVEIVEENGSLIFEETGVVGIGEIFTFEDAVGTDEAGVGSGVETGANVRDAVGMAEFIVVEGLGVDWEGDEEEEEESEWREGRMW